MVTEAQRAALEDEAVAYEVAAEAAITAELAADVAGANAAVIAAAATGVTGVALATAAAKAYRLVAPDMEGVGYEHALIGGTLGRRQARVVTDTEGRRGRPTRDDPEVGDAVRALDSRAQDRLDQAAKLTQQLSMDTFDDVSAVTSRAYSAVTRARADARWIATRSVSLGVAQIAADLGWQTMWVPERNACLQCLAYAGLVTEPWDLFPAGLTFADQPSTLDAVPYPPLHPNCRCRVEPYNGPLPRLDRSDPSPASDLAREARRSVVKGWSDYDSEPSRIRAADRLIRRGAELPPTVVATALRAIRRGVFRR